MLKELRIALLGAPLALLLTACASTPELGPEDLTPATQVVEKLGDSPPAALAGRFELLGEDDPELVEAIQKFRETGDAPVVKKPGFTRFPYGERQPILYCKPLRVCEIQLEPGETVMNVALGDSERWISSKMESGPPERRVPHVVVKPTEYDITTNLVITTDRRVYYLGLVSTTEEKGGYFRSVRFYYPQETVQRWADAAAAAEEEVRRERDRTVARLPLVDPESLHFGYRIRGDRVSWRPIQAFDDGTRVFIQMPERMRSTEAPALFVLTDGDEQTLVNYRVRGGYYVVDRLFSKAALVVGVGGKQKRVTVTRTHDPVSARR
jgi:type IV secretion system protein VirB9